MKVKSRILSIAISVLMILSMFVCGIDQTAFALENEGNAIADESGDTNDTNEVSEDGDDSTARLTPYYKVLQDAVRCYLVMLHCSDCNGYKALATGYNTK